MSDIAIIILTKNEKLHIGRCLERIAALSPRQVFVVDCFSTDGTQRIVEEWQNDKIGQTHFIISSADEFMRRAQEKVEETPRLMPLAEAVETVVHRQVAAGSNPSTRGSVPNAALERKGGSIVLAEHEWPGLQSVQFNWALDNLRVDAKWILRLDADEYLTSESIEWLKTNLDGIDEKVAALEFTLERKFMGGEIRHGTNGIQMVRMFRRGRGRYAETLMDERIVFEGEKQSVPVVFYDDNLNTLEWWKEKHRGYAKREAQQAIAGTFQDPRKAKYYKLPPYFRAVAYFCIRYFLKLGFLDGIAGWRWHFWQGLWYRWLVDREIGKLKSRPRMIK